MKKMIALAALLACGAGAAQAQVQDGSWMVRLRAVNLDMTNQDSTGLRLTVNDKVIPEVDVSYFFNKNVATELVLTAPQQQTVSSNGTSIGNFDHLPPTLMLQYHFTDLGAYKPYVGAGFNYTRITGVRLSAAGLDPVTLDGHSWGGALQVGVDIPLDGKWSLNLDLKKTYIQTNVYSKGLNVGTLKLDPVMAGIGIGYRF